MRGRDDFANVSCIHDEATMHSQEDVRVELERETRDGLSQQGCPIDDVELDVVVSGFDPVDGVQGHERPSAAIEDGHPLKIPGPAKIPQDG